jgi:ATP-dependent Lon protease
MRSTRTWNHPPVPADRDLLADAVGRSADDRDQHRRAGPAGGLYRVEPAVPDDDDKQELLETPDVKTRLERINKHLAKELEVQQLRNKIQTEVQDSVQQSQRDYYLREQMKAIQKELGDQDDTQKDIAELKEKIEAAGMPEETKKDALKELGRLSRMNPAAADYSLTRNYVEWLAVLPWSKSSAGEVDIREGEGDLDEDHYGLKKVKDRILDYLSVRRLKPDMKGPILCFVGPPGVGKTSLGRSDCACAGTQVLAHLAGRHA